MNTIKAFIDIFNSHIEYWNSIGVIDFWGIIIGAIIPLAIMRITLNSEKKRAAQDAIERDNQHQEMMKKAEQRHLELLHTQNDINRISIMPYLIKHKIELRRVKDNVIFDVEFINIGNGAAVELSSKYLCVDGESLAIADTFLATYNCFHPFDELSSVVQPNHICRFSIKQELKDTEVEENNDRFSFVVRFKDMRMNLYEQRFTIVFGNADPQLKVLQFFVESPEHITQ